MCLSLYGHFDYDYSQKLFQHIESIYMDQYEKGYTFNKCEPLRKFQDFVSLLSLGL